MKADRPLQLFARFSMRRWRRAQTSELEAKLMLRVSGELYDALKGRAERVGWSPAELARSIITLNLALKP